MVLESALEDYDGTLIAVSHDRYFLDRIVNRLIVLGEGSWHLVEGNYETHLRQQAASQDEGPQEDPEKAARKAAYEGARKVQREQQRKERQARRLQDRIEALEVELGRVDEEMAREDLQTDWERLQELSRDRSRLQGEIADCFAKWEEVEAERSDTRTV
jgi:ATP-binding cassette subfamily F protein 3